MLGLTGKLTHRQYQMWQAWLELEWDRPSRTDQYIMQLTTAVYRIMSTKPNKIKMKDFVLAFRKTAGQKLTEDEARDLAMAKWIGVAGVTPRVNFVDDDGNPVEFEGDTTWLQNLNLSA